MTQLYHLNCLTIVTPINDNVCGHCLLLNHHGRLILIDTGIGISDVLYPESRIGQPLIDMVGYRFNRNQTAFEQIKQLGFDPASVTDCIISHLDNDHTGGLSDFPKATVHVGQEEMNNYLSGNVRYLKAPLQHQPAIKTYGPSTEKWFDFEARRVDLGDADLVLYLIPLFGHSHGHCGIALKADNKWMLYAGDAYYMAIEFTDATHPVHQLAQFRADDNNTRLATMEKLSTFKEKHPEVDVFAYHDIEEFKRYQ